VLADSSLELVLANAAQVKNVPGRKSDIRALAKLRSHHRHRPGRDVFSRRVAGTLDLLVLVRQQPPC